MKIFDQEEKNYETHRSFIPMAKVPEQQFGEHVTVSHGNLRQTIRF